MCVMWFRMHGIFMLGEDFWITSCGLIVVIWSYPRGNLSKEGETAIDTIGYGAHIAALLGAHVIKVKLPSAFLENPEAKKAYQQSNIRMESLADRVRHVTECCFQGRRLVVFSGGDTKNVRDVVQDARDIHAGGGHGSIIGRNCFQRPRHEALALLEQLTNIYQAS